MRVSGHRAVLLFAILREGGSRFKAAAHIDPDYAALLECGDAAGVDVLLYRALFDGETITLREAVPWERKVL